MEKKLQQDFKEYFNKKGVLFIVPKTFGVKTRRQDPSMIGVSDFILCHRGKFIAIEVKNSDKDKPKKDQVDFVKKVRDSGGQGMVISSLDELIKIIG